MVKLEADSLCACPFPAMMEHATLPSLFPTRSFVRMGSFQPDPQLHSTAHTRVTVLSSTSEVWAGNPHPGEYQNHQLQVGVSCPPNTEDPERVTGRKARGLQTEEIACKCQTFLSLLSGRRKQTSDIYFSAAKSLQSCPTLYNPIDCSTPGFPVHHQLLEPTQTHVH